MNQSTTVQEGDFNNALTAQGQTNLESSGNKGLIRQGNGQQAENNYAALEQDGDDNQATIFQTYDNSDAWTRQIGDNNNSWIRQNARPNQSDGQEAWNYQEGEANESYIEQTGSGARNFANAFQYGDNNQARQIQNATATEGGTGNTATVRQGQLFNADALEGSVYARAYQNQTGENNNATINQVGGTMDASNYAEQNQDGNDNRARIDQEAQGNVASDNYARQDQTGDGNWARVIELNGLGNKILQTQIGMDNWASSSASGDGNMLNIHQRGDMNAAESIQRGDNNVGLIVQYDGQSYTLQQGLNFDNRAFNNQADILQMGPNGDFGAGAIPFGIPAPMNLDFNYTVDSFNLDPIN
jgi:hypothetical protein